MNITSCPQCGGRVRSISVGWKCESCQGFIDMRGEFHPHKEEPFMPPMTNADRIRAMSDEELAEFLERVHVDPCSACCDNLYWCRRNNAPEPVCKNHFLEWLQQPAKEEHDLQNLF